MEIGNSEPRLALKNVITTISLPLTEEVTLYRAKGLFIRLVQSDIDNTLRVEGYLDGESEASCLGEVSFIPELRTENKLRLEIKAIRNLMCNVTPYSTGELSDIAAYYVERYKVCVIVAEAVQELITCGERLRKDMVEYLLSEQDALDKEIEVAEKKLAERKAALKKDKNYVPDIHAATQILDLLKCKLRSDKLSLLRVSCASATIDRKNEVILNEQILIAESSAMSKRIKFSINNKALTQDDVLTLMNEKVVVIQELAQPNLD